AGRAAALIGLGQNRRVEVGAAQALGRAGPLDLGDPGRAAGFDETAGRGGAGAARGRGLLRARLDRGLPDSGLAGGDILALVGGDAVQNVAHQASSSSIGAWETRTSSAKAAAARPSSMTAAAISAPDFRSSARPATTRAAAAFSRTMSR